MIGVQAQEDVTSTYITNPSFEADGSISTSNGALTITGWTQSNPGSQYNNTGCYDKDTNVPSQGTVKVTPSDGDYLLFFRRGWAQATYTFTSAVTSLPAGRYTLSVDYKMVEGYDDKQNNNTKVIISAKNGDNVLGSGEGTTKENVSGGGAYTYLNTKSWSKSIAHFILTETTNVNVVISLQAGAQRRSDFVVDNVRLYYTPFDAAPINYSSVGAGDFYIVNAATGKYLGGANSWGTQASLIEHGIPFTAAASDGGYTLDSHTYNNESSHFFNGTYVDGGSTKLFVNSLGSGKYSISTADGSAYVTATSSTTVANTASDAQNTLAQWYFVSKADRDVLLSSATLSNPVDATYYLTEANISRNLRKAYNTSGWTGDKAYGGENYNQCLERYTKATDVYQVVTVPNGQYVVSCQGFYRQESGSAVSYLYANDETVALDKIQTGGINDKSQASQAFTVGEYKKSLTINVTDGTLKVGVKCDAATNWTIWDNFELYYYGPNLIQSAEEFTAGNTTVGGKWYYYDIPTNDAYEFTSSAATTLVYTTDGTQLTEVAIGTDESFTAGQKKEIELSAGRLYFKTSEATTLDITYKYNVGAATADYSHVQGGETVTVLWADASTNDPDATFAMNGTPEITLNGSPVDIVTTAKGFTFTVPEVSANSSYTLSIPANAFGYEAGSTFNEAQDITLYTPAVYDGTYYIKTGDGRYVSRGNNYNTRAIVDKYGIAVTTATDGSGKTTFLFVDNNKNLFEADNHEVYADNTNDKYWTVSATTGGFYIASANDKGSLGWKLQVTANGDSNYKYDYLMCSENSGSVFTFEVTTSHASQIAAMKDAQAASVATAIGQESITTKADLDNYAAKLSSYEYPDVDKVENGAEKYQGTGDITQTLTGLPNGLYKVSVNAFQRITGYSDDLYSGGYDLPTTSLYANSEEINVYSPFEQAVQKDTKWSDVTGDTEDKEYEGYYYPNNVTSAKNAIAAGNYGNEIYVNVTDGTLRFGIFKTNKIANSDWLYYKDFAVTFYSSGDAGTELERSILSDRITAAYATIPEENVGTNAFQYSQSQVSERLTKIHTAEGVCDNPSATVEQLREQTEILKGETTAISQNVPAEQQKFYLQQVSGNNWADFSDGCKLNSEAKIVYFTAVNGGYKLSNDETNFVYYSGTGNDKWTLNTTTDGGATWTVEYLGAGKYALHSNNGYLGSDASASGSTLYGNKGKNVSNSNWIIVDSKVTMTIDGTAKRGTFCAPFDVAVSDLPEGVTAYTAEEGVNGGHLALTKVTETIPAGTPVILDAPGIAATTSKDFTGVYASEPKNTGVLKGVYATTLITSDDDNSLYIMQYKSGTTAFYKVPTDDSRRVGANRCYLLIEGESPARINLGEEIDPTAINAVKVADTKAEGLKDGKYLINGKIVLVKNGVMYSTNGQKLN